MTDPDARPLATLFVMAYRQEATVRAAIESAFAQDYAPLEILLTDDASPDGTYAIMEEMAAAYDGPHRVILNRNPTNLGVTGHVDRIMELASGEAIFHNAGDDVSEPDRVSRLMALRARTGALLLHSAAEMIDETGAALGLKTSSPAPELAPGGPGLPAREMIARNVYVLGATCGWDRKLFDVFGPLGREAGVEDIILPARAAILGGPSGIAGLEARLLNWRVGGASWAWRHEIRAQDYLFGGRLRDLRWRAASHRRIQADLARPEATAALGAAERDACLAVSRAHERRQDFEVAAAEAGPLGRLAMIPRALRLKRETGERFFPVQLAKYLLHPIYARYLDWRYPPEKLRW